MGGVVQRIAKQADDAITAKLTRRQAYIVYDQQAYGDIRGAGVKIGGRNPGRTAGASGIVNFPNHSANHAWGIVL
jgi:hypothetical protein